MWKLIVSRLLAAVPILFLVAVCVFTLYRFVPIQAPAVILGEAATPEAVQRLSEEMGLDQPAPVLFFKWLSGALQGDFGQSYISGRQVTEEVWHRLPITLMLATGGMVIALLIGIPCGVLAAVKRNSFVDRFLTGATSVLLAIPSFWLALLLVLFFAVKLRWLPAAGYTPAGTNLHRWFVGFLLPWFSLGLGLTASIARQTRSADRKSVV